MNVSLPFNDNTVRGVVFGMILSALLLMGLERGAQWYEASQMADPSVPESFGSPHPYLLWELPPGETVVNEQRVAVNSVGARGTEIAQPKPQNLRRILFLGDQTTFGQGVSLNRTFAYDAVESLGGSRVGLEPLMMAVPDYTATQHLNLMDLRGWSLEPDLVIIGGPSIEMSVQTYRDEDVIAMVKQHEGPRAMLQQYALFRVLDRIANLHRNERAVRRTAVFGTGANFNPNGEPRLGTNAYAATLDRLVVDALDRDTPIVFVMTPVSSDMTGTELTDSLQLYRDAMRSVAQRHGVPVVDGPSIFQNSRRQTGQLFLNQTLLTEQGHRVLGYSLAKVIKPWMRGRSVLRPGTGEPLPTLPEPENEPSAL